MEVFHDAETSLGSKLVDNIYFKVATQCNYKRDNKIVFNYWTDPNGTVKNIEEWNPYVVAKFTLKPKNICQTAPAL